MWNGAVVVLPLLRSRHLSSCQFTPIPPQLAEATAPMRAANVSDDTSSFDCVLDTYATVSRDAMPGGMTC